MSAPVSDSTINALKLAAASGSGGGTAIERYVEDLMDEYDQFGRGRHPTSVDSQFDADSEMSQQRLAAYLDEIDDSLNATTTNSRAAPATSNLINSAASRSQRTPALFGSGHAQGDAEMGVPMTGAGTGRFASDAETDYESDDEAPNSAASRRRVNAFGATCVEVCGCKLNWRLLFVALMLCLVLVFVLASLGS
jgi:hypothetical protein